MEIRQGTMNDLDKLVEVEQKCFPLSEAASKAQLKERLDVYANHFWLLVEDEKIISFIDGFVTNQRDLEDEMYENASMHDENGDWQMIFGVNTIPEYQHRGYASQLMKVVIEKAKEEHKKGLVLTCKEELLPFYERLGFINEGISSSVHGNVTWYQMRLLVEGE